MCLITTQFILASKIYIRTQLSSSVAVFVVLSKAEVVSLQVLNIFHALSLCACVRACVCVCESLCVVIVCHYVLHCVFSHLVTSLWEMRKLIALLILSLAVYRASKFYFVLFGLLRRLSLFDIYCNNYRAFACVLRPRFGVFDFQNKESLFWEK